MIEVPVPARPDLEALDDDVLRDAYDAGSLLRGRGYAAEDRVELLRVEPGAIEAVCRGSGRSTYVSRIRWDDWRGYVEVDDSCTCPLGGACKHCVAAILVARRESAPAGRSGIGSTWRQALADLAVIDRDPHGVALALQVAIQQPRSGAFMARQDPRPTIRPLRRGRSGSWVKTGASWRDLASPYGHRSTEYDPAQIGVLRALMAAGQVGYYSNIQAIPFDQFGADLWSQLERAVECGIVLVGESPGSVVDLSPTPATLDLDLVEDTPDAVRLVTSFMLDGVPVSLAEGGLVGSPTHGLWAFDGDRLRLAPLHAPLHPVLARLATAPPLAIPIEDLDEFLDDYQPVLAGFGRLHSSDASVTIAESRFVGLVLVVERIALDRVQLRWQARYRRGERVADHPLARSGGRARDRAAERRAVTELELPVDLMPRLVDPTGTPRDLVVSGPEVVTVLTEALDRLAARGQVAIEVTGDQPELREATTDPLISLTVADAERSRDGNDWFDLEVEVTVDGEVVDFPSLFAALHRGDPALILASGTWLRLDRPELDRLRDLIDEAHRLVEPADAAVARVSPYQAGWWEELAGLGVVATQSRRWSERIARISALTAPEPLTPPSGLAAVLRPYQQEGFEWLAFLQANGLGGILADDMGLGKTVQTLALALRVHEQQPEARVLVVAPTSVVENWAREAARFVPDLAVRTIRETEARRGTALADEIGDATLVVTSYALFRLEFDEYARLDWALLLLDEAQFVKNHQAKTYQCVRRLEARTKVAITGTPLENSLMDLWSLLSITAPGFFPDPKRFDQQFRRPIERGDAPELAATLRRRIAPLVRRRTKDEVLTELPPKTEQTVEIELSARHARIYGAQLQRQRQKVLGLVGDVAKHRFEIFRSLTLLRQLALDPALIDEAHEGVGSAKLDRLVEDLAQVVAEGHRALVFSQFTRYLARARARLDDAGIGHSYLDGRTRRRDEAIGRFKDGEVPVFLISLKAGGVGLNLTEADYCFLLDPWWNPATETQAVDRTHRIGQENPVMVYRYVSVGTIEEKVMELKARKAGLFASMMETEGALSGPLTADDVRGLLALD